MKKRYFLDSFEEYLKMISPYAKVEVVELEAEAFNDSNQDKSKDAEDEKIIKFLKKSQDKEIIILDEKGKEFSSEELTGFFRENGNYKFIFIIGGSLGFGEKIKNYPAMKMALSRMTFPHEMTKVILIEQLYRAMTIMNNKKYHY